MSKEIEKEIELETEEELPASEETTITSPSSDEVKDFEKLYEEEKKAGVLKAAAAGGIGMFFGIFWIKKMWPGLKRIFGDIAQKNAEKKARKLAEKQALQDEE